MSTENTIDALRSELFATLRALRDPEQPMDIARAKAVSDIAQTIINTAKVEIEHQRVTGARQGTKFLPAPEEDEPAKPNGAKATTTGTKTISQIGGATVTQHRMR
jgi:hypothetical protein